MLSLDIAYIDNSWTYQARNIGIVHCKEGTSGEQVAKYVLPALERHGLVDKVYAYVKDQGSNLRTTAQALSNALSTTDSTVCCKAIGLPKPYTGETGPPQSCSHCVAKPDMLAVASDCYAHALNGACNKAVGAAKKLGNQLNVEAALKKLREACTYIKKSSVGLKAYVIACREVRVSPTKIPTPAKTRFTSVSALLLLSLALVCFVLNDFVVCM